MNYRIYWNEIYVRSATVVEREFGHRISDDEETAKAWVAAEIRSGRARMWRGCGPWVWRNICAWSGVDEASRIKARDRELRRAVDKLRSIGYTVIPTNADITGATK